MLKLKAYESMIVQEPYSNPGILCIEHGEVTRILFKHKEFLP
jgi:hypothetical protein